MATRGAHWSDVYVRGLAGAVIAALAGVWLVAAPFVFAYQPEGEEWVDATRVGVWTGAPLIAAAVVAAVLLAAGIRGEMALVRTPAAAAQPAYDDLDRAMAEVTAALLADLHHSRTGEAAGPSEDSVNGQDVSGHERKTS